MESSSSEELTFNTEPENEQTTNKEMIAEEQAASTFLSSDIIEVLVGPQKVRLSVHKGVVCEHCPYFEKCFAEHSSFVERKTKTVVLPDDEPEVVAALLEWIYLKKLPKPPGTDAWMASPENYKLHSLFWTILIKIFCLADKFCMEPLKNQITDHLKEYCTGRFLHIDALALFLDLGPPSCGLRRFMLEQAAHDTSIALKTNRDASNLRTGNFREFLAKGGDGAAELALTLIVNVQILMISPPTKRRNCAYHDHTSTEKCK